MFLDFRFRKAMLAMTVACAPVRNIPYQQMTVANFHVAKESSVGWHIHIPNLQHKTGSNFDCTLPHEIYDIMKKYVALLKKEFNIDDENLYLFPSKDGGMLSNLSDAIRRANMEILGMPFTSNDHRHAVTTTMRGSGMTGDLIAGALCHSEATAKRDYFHSEPKANPTFPSKSGSFSINTTSLFPRK